MLGVKCDQLFREEQKHPDNYNVTFNSTHKNCLKVTYVRYYHHHSIYRYSILLFPATALLK